MSPTRRPRKTKAFLLLGLVLVAAAVGAGLLLRPQLTEDAGAGSTPTPVTAGPVDAEAAAATSSAPYTIKAEPSTVATDDPQSTGSGWVDVVLTYAAFDAASGTVQASGFVGGLIENGGTCTLTLTRDGEEVTATSEAEADANATSCGLLESPTGLASGTWEAVLSYSSAEAEGNSGSLEVSVP